MSIACPCCGKPMDLDPVAILATVKLTPLERRICDCLARSFGKWVPRVEIINAMYWDRPDGGALNGGTVLSVLMHNLKPKIAAVGLAIVPTGLAGHGDGSRRMVWLSPPVLEQSGEAA